MKLDHQGFLHSLYFGHSKKNFALGTVPHQHSNRNRIISTDTSSVSLSYLIPACSSPMTWEKNYLSGSVSKAASAAAPTAAGASCIQFTPSSLFPPGCIRLMVEVRHSQLGHHQKKTSFSLLSSQRISGGWKGSFSSFLLHLFWESEGFFLILQQKNMALPLTYLCGSSCNSSVRDDLRG